MPLESIHKFAFKAAQAASCAGEQGKYWEMHDRLFENQKALEPWTPHAEAVGLDVAKFEACLASGKFDQKIRRDMGEARKVGVTGTPAFMIGRTEPSGTKVKVLAVLKGAKAFADFKAELDRLLEEAAKPQADAPKPPAEVAKPQTELVPAGGVAPGPEAEPKTAAPPARASLAPGGKLDETTRASLERVLGTAPAGSPAWIAAPSSDARAVALAQELSGAFTRAGWRVRPVRRTTLAFKPRHLPLRRGRRASGLRADRRSGPGRGGFRGRRFATGYRPYYDEKKKADPKFQGFPFAPEQTFLVVIGRTAMSPGGFRRRRSGEAPLAGSRARSPWRRFWRWGSRRPATRAALRRRTDRSIPPVSKPC